MLRTWTVRPTRHYSAPSPLLLFFASPLSTTAFAAAAAPPSSVASSPTHRFAMSRSLRIAVVGDVHDHWELEEDARALHFLQADLVLLTGDFGNENVELVRSISISNFQKQQFWGTMIPGLLKSFQRNLNQLMEGNLCVNYILHLAFRKTDRVHLQLECFGEEHVGYCRLDFPMLKLCILGGRPFSCGGDALFRPRLLSSRYGVNNMEESAKKIYEAALGTPEGHCVIILAHNGPTGLGSKVSDICGRDWILGGGDYGDPDLARAISDLKRDTQIPIPLVVFGHMHKELAYGNGLRKMIVVGTDNTIYLNGAIVPRVKHVSGSSSGSSTEDQNQFQTSETGTLRAFTMVEILNGLVIKIVETWVLVAGSKIEIEQETVLFQKQ